MDLIERDAVLDLGYWHPDPATCNNHPPGGVNAVDEEDIEDLPRIDPVRYGCWLPITADEMYGSGSYKIESYFCSECNGDVCWDDVELSKYSYCPYCGAYMGGRQYETD